jgi:hypothetical protein
MQLQQRKNFFMVFAVFFIICTPFMILYSSGFSINNTEISNSIAIKTDTVPRLADILIDDKKTAISPYELTTTDTGIIDFSIQKAGFVSENFTISKENNQNSFADITNFWLLPKTSTESSISKEASAASVKSISNNQIISENQTVVEYQVGNKLSLGIMDFGIAGRVGEVQPISSSAVVGGKSIIELELNTQTKIKLLSKDQEYKKFGNDLFFKNNILLIRKSGYWLSKDLDKLKFKTQSIARVNSSSVVILDTEKNLWTHNFETEQTKFIDTGFSKMKTLSMPSTIWLWKNDTIYRLEPADVFSENIIWNRYEYLKNNIIEEQNGQIFDVQNLYQGIVFQVGRYLMYVPDYKKNQWQIISANANSLATIGESIFWLDTEKNLWTHNFNNNLVRNLAQNIELTDKISYSDGWKRIMLYYPTGVDSIWYNKDIVNNTIKSFSKQTWITNQNCFPKVVDRVQYCLENQDLRIYKNNNLF